MVEADDDDVPNNYEEQEMEIESLQCIYLENELKEILLRWFKLNHFIFEKFDEHLPKPRVRVSLKTHWTRD